MEIIIVAWCLTEVFIWACVGGGGWGAWSFAFQHSLNPHRDFAVLLLCVSEYPIISGDKGKLGRRNITDAAVSASPCVLRHRERDRHRPTKKKREKENIPHTHLSIPFTSHCDALWVMLELEHGTENLWMSLYTYMDDEDAFWVPWAWRRYVGSGKGRSNVRRIQNKWSNLNYLEVQTENSTSLLKGSGKLPQKAIHGPLVSKQTRLLQC